MPGPCRKRSAQSAPAGANSTSTSRMLSAIPSPTDAAPEVAWRTVEETVASVQPEHILHRYACDAVPAAVIPCATLLYGSPAALAQHLRDCHGFQTNQGANPPKVPCVWGGACTDAALPHRMAHHVATKHLQSLHLKCPHCTKLCTTKDTLATHLKRECQNYKYRPGEKRRKVDIIYIDVDEVK
ncbi:hypothetical protein B0H10DRAFT_1414018 [Mycena sp. CBHHK59/15]|nr:hypothetical protein B0H10DRAFT_1414018 [Mycena sp. CBHHK59/15]